ncbi:helix-turn-helix domain-containing protein [Chitinophaga pinensis]|uniref:Transcriptional regulator, AraC family n=1 Tax=Chitinophaga pinensis (strain ATCC 43595 / DSM 2588 / LMG 13176 / NBRC 15968 / NCIMB 11800 / UQM 2034) TaxID=485918 RepID=A0A979G276_CHIPD|nr:helix-turn-helix transcriptional regulator [Chitinophaga pinensis]ACU59263.1 transcriptional regulator, AraC family [Chitinophaga pinensis DSM 2588]
MQPYRVKTIAEFLQLRGLPKTQHPLISVIDIGSLTEIPRGPKLIVTDFYMIALKKGFAGNIKVRYGQKEYDFDEGILSFTGPGQLLGFEMEGPVEGHPSGWMLLLHPDFLWNTPLAKKIRQYEFFDYAVNEALFLSEKEEITIRQIITNIDQEYHANIDQLSHDIIISHMESLFNYSERFYRRQFLTRRISHHQLLDKLEDILQRYLDEETGLPTVTHVAEALHVSPDYLSSMLKTLTGLNTQQHIHQKLIEKAKEQLSTTTLSVSEIAYQLGFEHPQSFSKLFKTKTNLSPVAFRKSFQ